MEQYDFDDIEIDSQYYTTNDVRLNTTKYVTKERFDELKTERDKLEKRIADLESCYRCAKSEADSILSDLRKCEAELSQRTQEAERLRELAKFLIGNEPYTYSVIMKKAKDALREGDNGKDK